MNKIVIKVEGGKVTDVRCNSHRPDVLIRNVDALLEEGYTGAEIEDMWKEDLKEFPYRSI